MLRKGMRPFLAVIMVLVLSPSLYIHATSVDMHVCGFEQKCKGNRTDVERNTKSCCKRCECADICKERGTCCTDDEHLIDTEDVVKQECLPALYVPRGIKTRMVAPSFFTRTRCPSMFEDESIKAKCESLTPSSLEDIVFVSSEDGSIVYKNRFCGLCHGEKKMKPWTEMIHLEMCSNKFTENITSAATLEHNLLQHCLIFLIKPDGLDLRSSACIARDKVINQCNKTNDWDVYDSELEGLCLHSPESVYYYDFTYKAAVVFSNLYCYLCNTRSNIGPSTCRNAGDTDGRFTDISLLNLINKDLWKESGDLTKTSMKETKSCQKDEILDTFFSTCRRLYCPTFFLSVNGQCVPVLDVTFCYRFVVRLVPIDRMNKSESVKKELKTRVSSIQKKLGFGRCKSSKLSMFLTKGINETMSGIVIRFVLDQDLKGCKLEYMLSKLTHIQTSPSYIKLMLNGMMTEFNVFSTNLSEPSDWKRSDVDVEMILTTTGFASGPIFPLERGSLCPRVRLTMIEYRTVLQRHAFAHDLFFVPGQEEANGSMYVCCEKYILESLATGVKISASVIICMMAFIFVISENIS